MAKKILFLTGPGGRDIFMWKLCQEMSKHEEITPYFIVNTQIDIDFLLSKGVSKKNIFEIIAQGKSGPDLNILQEYEKKYGLNLWDAWSVTAARNKKRRAKIKPKDLLSWAQYYFERVETLIKEIKPDYYVNLGGPCGLGSIINYKVFEGNNVGIIQMEPALIPNRFTILKDISNLNPLLIINYQDIKKNGLSKEEKENAEQFIKNHQEKPQRAYCANQFKGSIIQQIKKYFLGAYHIVKYRVFPPNLRFLFWPIIQKFYDHLGIFEKPKPGEKYLLFPLHYQPESTTLIHGKWHVDQATLIENISRSVPVSHKLYVKEHYFGYGNRHLRFYKRIKRLPNVRLISPHENNFEIIKNCSLLATITGSSGWEALLFQKPVITFGNISYNIFEETKKVEKIAELPTIIRERLGKKIKYNDLVESVAAMLKSSYSGFVDLPNSCANYSLKEENIKLLAKGVLDYINKTENVLIKLPQY